jgi:hypothetical protein
VHGELVPDVGRETAQGLIERGDPRGRDQAARWALASSDPICRSAFERVVQDPLSSPEVAATFRRAAGG